MKTHTAKVASTLVACIGLGLLLTGCGAAPKNYKVSPSFESSMQSKNNLALITDVCMRMDESGEDTDHFIVYGSEEINGHINSALTTKLQAQGYKVNATLDNSMCAGYKKPSIGVLGKVIEDSEIGKINLPYYYQKEQDSELQKAVNSLLYRTRIVAGKNQFDKVFFTDKSIIDSMDYIKEKTQQNKLLVTVVNGSEISTAKAMGQGFKGALFGGKVAVEFLRTKSVLLDLDNHSALWTIDTVFKGPDLYDSDFYHEDYYELVHKSLETK